MRTYNGLTGYLLRNDKGNGNGISHYHLGEVEGNHNDNNDKSDTNNCNRIDSNNSKSSEKDCLTECNTKA